jgi:hypothetical protein
MALARVSSGVSSEVVASNTFTGNGFDVSLDLAHSFEKRFPRESAGDRKIQVLNSFQFRMNFALAELQGYNRLALAESVRPFERDVRGFD